MLLNSEEQWSNKGRLSLGLRVVTSAVVEVCFICECIMSGPSQSHFECFATEVFRIVEQWSFSDGNFAFVAFFTFSKVDGV